MEQALTAYPNQLNNQSYMRYTISLYPRSYATIQTITNSHINLFQIIIIIIIFYDKHG